METWLQMVITIVCSVLASSGFWAYIQKRSENNDAKTKLLLGLAHDRIVCLGLTYIERGYITKDEYEDFVKYLYRPYHEANGNGSGDKIMTEVNKLPIHGADYHDFIRNGGNSK